MNINELFLTQTVQDHVEIKDSLLEAIAECPINTIINEPYERITNTDWNKSLSANRPYLSLADLVFKPHLEMLAKKFYVETVTIENFWYQQYAPGDYHYWHLHPKTMFSSIYFLELPNNGQTQFFLNGTKLLVNVIEGQILTFPSFFVHCSPPNKSNQRKTVIVFNTNVDDVYENIGY